MVAAGNSGGSCGSSCSPSALDFRTLFFLVFGGETMDLLTSFAFFLRCLSFFQRACFCCLFAELRYRPFYSFCCFCFFCIPPFVLVCSSWHAATRSLSFWYQSSCCSSVILSLLLTHFFAYVVQVSLVPSWVSPPGYHL